MKPSIKLKKITLRDNQYTDNSDKEFDLTNITIIVGPNNGGKSQILRDIYRYLDQSSEMKLVRNVELDFPQNESDLTELLSPIMGPYEKQSHGQEGDVSLRTITVDSENPTRHSGFNLPTLISEIIKQGMRQIHPHITKFFILRLDGRNRFQLISNKAMGKLDRADNMLQKIVQDTDRRKKIKDAILEEFGLHFYTSVSEGAFEIRLSPEYNKTADENLMHLDSLKFFKTIPKIEELGDGIQCFTGLIIALHSVNSTMFFIDEPEAFLHPPQARHLAHHFVKICQDNNSSLLVSTHSSNFLIGCLEKTDNLNIVRMSYDGKIGTSKCLNSENIKELTQDPLLRSTKTLEGLFHKSVIVVEADSDRVLYEEINRRLNQKNRGHGDTIFINGIGKDVLHRIVSGLRKLGVPTACIYDLDFIELPEKSKKDMWEERLQSFGFTSDEISTLNKERFHLLSEFEKIKTPQCAKPIKKKGIYGLSEDSLKKAEEFLKKLAEKGLHLVPVGTLEEWLNEFSVEERQHKLVWLVQILEKLGKENSKEFVEPRNDDIWQFIDEISFN